MANSRPYTVNELVLKEVNRHEYPNNDDRVHHALETLRQMIRKQIKDSRWSCTAHDPLLSSSDCEDCSEAREVNVIVDNILGLSTIGYGD